MSAFEIRRKSTLPRQRRTGPRWRRTGQVGAGKWASQAEVGDIGRGGGVRDKWRSVTSGEPAPTDHASIHDSQTDPASPHVDLSIPEADKQSVVTPREVGILIVRGGGCCAVAVA